MGVSVRVYNGVRTDWAAKDFICNHVFLIIVLLHVGSTCGRIFKRIHRGTDFSYASGFTMAWHGTKGACLFYWYIWKMALQLQVWQLFKADFISLGTPWVP